MKRSAKLLALRAKAKREGWIRWIHSEADERAMLEQGCYFSAQRGEHVVEFGRKFLRHTEGSTWAGKPFELMDWQYEKLFMPLFGWVRFDPEWDQVVRRYRTAYVELPKKNGKSPTGAYIGLYMLLGDGEYGARVFSVATSKEQASIVHGHAISMAEASPQLSARLKINRTTKRIVFPSRNSYYAVLSSAPRRNEGWNGNCCIADELHQWQGSALYDALRWMFSSRPEPLFFMITTAGDDTTGVCYQQYEYAKSVANGRVVDHTYFPLIYEASHNDDFGAIATWKKANPSFGITVKASEFRATYQQVSSSPAGLGKFAQLRLNVWGTGRRAWLNELEWDAGPNRRKEAA